MPESVQAESTASTFQAIVADSLGIDPSDVTPESTLEELGAQSLDVVEISMETESRFNIWLPDKSILETAIEVAGRDAILDGSHLSELGKDLFRARLPGEERELLEGDVTTADLQNYFMRVSTWVRLIDDIRAHTPKVCSVCDHTQLSNRPGFVLSCDECGHEMKLRAGEEINRDWVETFLAAREGRAPSDSEAARALSGSSALR